MKHTLICQTSHSSTNYEIEIDKDILLSQSKFLHSLASRVAIITDDNVAPLYGKQLQAHLTASGLETYLFIFPHGEHNKTRSTKEALENQLFEKGLGRDTCLIALGGGVVTDMGGYIAATYCRGIPLVLIPTSLLGMVDACIGGKTGVNVPFGKNMLGCFYPPKKVCIDLSTLHSLSLKDRSNGAVEMIKHGLIADLELFEEMEKHPDQILNPVFPHVNILEKMISESCRIKKEIVEQDERENGKRRLLNYGHTVGHGLESLTHYALSHGEAVAIGLLVESFLAVDLGILDICSFQRIRNILTLYKLPLSLPSKFSPQLLLDAMLLDKKSLKSRPRFVMIEAIGSPLDYDGKYCTHVDEIKIKNVLQWMNDDLCCY